MKHTNMGLRKLCGVLRESKIHVNKDGMKCKKIEKKFFGGFKNLSHQSFFLHFK